MSAVEQAADGHDSYKSLHRFASRWSVPLFIVSPRVIERVAFKRHAGGTGYRSHIRDKKLLAT